MKKILAVLLSLFMVLGLGVASLADDNPGSITVDNPIPGQTYTAYKIFSVVYDTNQDGSTGTHYAYTIKSDSAWFETVAKYALPENSGYNANQSSYTGANGLTLTQSASDPTVYVVETTNVFSAPDFAKALKTALDSMETKPTGAALTRTGDTGPVSASKLELGYYFVTSTAGALASLTTTNPSATIHDKNDIPFNKTETVNGVTYDSDNTDPTDDIQSGGASVQIGDTVNYTVTGKVPDTTGFTAYTYLITDTMSDGLTFKKDVKVYIGNGDNPTEVTSACTVTYDVEGNANKFTVLIPVINYQTQVTEAIKVTYSATVNEKAVAQIEKNSAVLTYSNDPTNAESKEITPPDVEQVYSAKILIDKYAKNANNETDTSAKLAGAQFVLYKEVTTGEGDTAVTTTYYYKWNNTDKKVAWVTLAENQTVAAAITAGTITAKATDDGGAASFDGIADGTYYLLETKAPDGYNLLDGPVEVEVKATKNATTQEINSASLTVTKGVGNKTGTLLPSTGGVGTTLFYVVGGVLVAAAAVFLVVRRRMNSEGGAEK